MEDIKSFKPYVAPEQNIAEFTVKSVVFGALFGILFGSSTVYLARQSRAYCYSLHTHSAL